jgi:hypothetical protein
MKMAVGCTARLGWKTTRDEELEQSRRALPKNLIRPLPYRIAKASGSGNLLSRSPVHAGARDEVDYEGGASSERWQNPRSVSGVCGGSRARVYIGGKDKLGSEAQFRKPRRARASSRVESRRASEEEEERACDTSLLTHLPSGATPHLICWSTSLPTFYVGLNLAPTSCLCAAKNMDCISHGLTHMGFQISRNF